MRSLHQLFLAALVLAGSATGQGKQSAERAWAGKAQAWLAAGGSDQDALDAIGADLAEAEDSAGLRWLASKLRSSSPDSVERRSLAALVTATALAYVDREVESEMTFAGQFEPLSVLMPEVGQLFLNLVLDTPEWFPEDRRATLVPALRDLYPEGPDRSYRRELRAVAEDAELEMTTLRESLALALAQWGDRSLVQEKLAELEEQSGSGANQDELFFMRQLAQLHYELRDYRVAAETWKRVLRRSEELELPVAPADYYNGACNLCLSGDLDAAFAELDRCAKAMTDPYTDESLKLEKELFERDPDLRTLRPMPRFRALVDKMFAKDQRP